MVVFRIMGYYAIYIGPAFKKLILDFLGLKAFRSDIQSTRKWYRYPVPSLPFPLSILVPVSNMVKAASAYISISSNSFLILIFDLAQFEIVTVHINFSTI